MSTHETVLQRAVQEYLSDPSIVLRTHGGRRLQVLSPGRINPHEGPDFVDMAILLDGMVIVGNGEFHRKSSSWFDHNHHNDRRYRDLILHLVFDHDTDRELAHDLLVLDKDTVMPFTNTRRKPKSETDIFSLEDLQHFALLRLLRKTAEARRLLNDLELPRALERIVAEFIHRYNSRRKRPVYNTSRLGELIRRSPQSKAAEFLTALERDAEISVADEMQLVLRRQFHDEGAHLRREIILNCVLPLALSLAPEARRIDLFLWYWSTPALNQYGALKRRFADLPQNFLWQQQGMLEYLREHGRRRNVCSEALRDYGLAATLSFYRMAGAHLEHPVAGDDY